MCAGAGARALPGAGGQLARESVGFAAELESVTGYLTEDSFPIENVSFCRGVLGITARIQVFEKQVK